MASTSTAPVGVATKAGLAGSVGLFAAAVVAAVQDQTPESIASAAYATLLLVATQGGRYAQAVAQIRAGVDALDAELDGLDDIAEQVAAAPVTETVPTDTDETGEAQV
ncbi:MAG: hypothetical protein QM679_12455 [Patulibacter sp.]